MKYKSKRGTVINIPDNISPKQIAQIKADADAGYGTRAQQTANKLGKKVTIPKGEIPPGTPLMEAPPQYFNNKGQIEDPDKVIQNLAPTPNMDSLLGDIAKAREGQYSYLTRDFEARKAQELEAKKQEMAERGIPYNPAAEMDPNSKDLYGRTIGGIERSYKDQYAQASNQAYSDSLAQGTQAYNAAVGAAGQQNNSFLTAILGMSDAELKRYGINKDFIAKKYAVDHQKTGGGGGGGGEAPGGFEIIG